MKTGFIIAFLLFSNIVTAQWQQTNLTSGNINCITSDGTTLFAGRNNRVYKSTNNGLDWAISSYGLTSSTVNAIQIVDTNIYAGTFSGVYRSTNNGVSWSIMNNGLTNLSVNDLIIRDTTVFVGTYDGLFRSEDNGNNWTLLVNGLPQGSIPPNSILSLGVTGNLILAGVYGAGVYASTTNGDSWSPSGSGISIYDNIYGGFGFNGNKVYACSYNGVYKSNNGGGSWTHSVNGLTSYNINAAAISDTNVFVSTIDGVYLSSINGNFWTKINDGFPATIAIKSLFVKGDTLFAGSNNNLGVWYRLLGEVLTSIEDNNYTPYNLLPNPTTGSFRIENKGDFHLIEIYNILGEKIYSTTDRNIDVIDISKNLSGLYFVKIYDKEKVHIEKIIKK